LVNLREYLPEETFEGFDERLLKGICSSSDNKLVGIPFYLYVSALFSNTKLLAKYDKRIPKTWDELMETSKIIYDEEKKLNHTIVRYNGLINDTSGSMTVFEFINSFRDSNESPHPYINSKTTEEALKKLKEMKDEIGEDIFKGTDMDGFMYLYLPDDVLFVNYNYNPHNPIFKATALPGNKEGVSGSIVIGHNLGINKYISEEKKRAAAEFLKFVASKETQKKFIAKDDFVGGLTSLYDDDEVCRMLDCEIIKDAYPFSFMNNDLKHYADDTYHEKYREGLFKYIYGNEPLSTVLKKVEDVTKIYTLQMGTDDSVVGLIILIVCFIFLAFILFSLVFVFIKKFEKKFDFLTKEMWVITVLGSVMILSSIFTLYDSVENYKCQLKVALINVGFVLSISPSIHRLITNFPNNNKASLWVDKNKFLFILVVMIFSVGLNGILATTTYNARDITMTDERHYEKCYMNNTFGRVIYYLIQMEM